VRLSVHNNNTKAASGSQSATDPMIVDAEVALKNPNSRAIVPADSLLTGFLIKSHKKCVRQQVGVSGVLWNEQCET